MQADWHPISPEYQAILEEEYQKNQKPDKAERTRIVGRVALGEKEVQVCQIQTCYFA